MIKKILNKEFVRNILTLVGGTGLSQLVLFAFTPILTRLFTPNDFGAFSVYLAVISIVGIIASLKYELALVLPKDEKDAKALLLLCLILNFSISLLSGLILVAAKVFEIRIITDYLAGFIWYVPFGILIAGLVQTFSSYVVRFKLFKHLSISRVVQATSSSCAQIGSKFISAISNALIIGHMVGWGLNFLYLLYACLKNNYLDFRGVTKEKIIANIKEHKNFPKYQSPSNFINTFTKFMPIIMLTAFYSPEIAGYYAITTKALFLPTMLIANATREVYRQKASELQNMGIGLRGLFIKTTMGLVVVGIIPYLTIWIFSEQIFTIFFGEEWRIAGEYSRYLIPWIFLVFISPPATTTLYIIGKQKVELIFGIYSTVFRVLSLIFAFYCFKTHHSAVFFYGIAGFLSILFIVILVYKMLSPKQTQ